MTAVETKLRDALLHLAEVQVKPSTEYATEWSRAVEEARQVLRETKEKVRSYE